MKTAAVPNLRGPALLDPTGGAVSVSTMLRRLRDNAGTHSPSVAQLHHAIPGVVRIDACYLSNPYATEEVLRRLRDVGPQLMARIVSHYPTQSGVVAANVAPALGVASDELVLGNGACQIIEELLDVPGPLVISLPTFSAYYEFARGPVVPNFLDPAAGFALELDRLDELIDEHRPDTVVVITPNNPDGRSVDHAALTNFALRTQGRVRQLIVDESFGAFTTAGQPTSLAPLVTHLPHLVVVNSLSKSHGIAGLRLGYAVAAVPRARELRQRSLWNLNGFAEWFCDLLLDADFQSAYELARRRYVDETRRFFDSLRSLIGVRVHPTNANFALLETATSAEQIADDLLLRHGIYVRDCRDKWGLEGDRFLRLAARTDQENREIISAVADVLTHPEGKVINLSGCG